MFGLTIEKLFLVALIGAVLIGPHRLPHYAGRLVALLRRLRDMAGEARRRAEEDSGVTIVREDWRALDPRQYDPRRIIREAWRDAEVSSGSVQARGEAAEADVLDAPGSDPAAGSQTAAAAQDAPEAPAVAVTPPEGRWVVTGSSAHPRRVWVAAEALSEEELLAAAS